MTFSEPPQGDYRLRGFLTASAAGTLTRLAYVFDIYDRKGRRVQRLSDELGVKAAEDPWAAVDDKALELCAARGAKDVAEFLATTPEANAVAGGEAGVTVVAARRESLKGSKPTATSGVAQLQAQ